MYDIHYTRYIDYIKVTLYNVRDVANLIQWPLCMRSSEY